MDNENKVVETKVTPEPTPEAKFTQSDMDKAVGHFKKQVATELGIERYDKDSMSKYLESNKSSSDVRETIQKENSDLITNLANKDKDINLLKADVLPDQLDNAKALVQVELTKNPELEWNQGLERVMESMPFLKKSVPTTREAIKPKVGVEIQNSVDTRTEQQKFMDSNPKYKNSKYVKN